MGIFRDQLAQSLIPLIVFNAVLLATVVIFIRVSKVGSYPLETEGRPNSVLLSRWLKDYWYWLTDPVVRLFIRLKLSPNMITSMGLGLGVVTAYFYAVGNLGLAGWLLIFGASFDVFDGRVARLTNCASRSGAYLDAVIDRISEGMAIAGMAYYYRNSWVFWVAITALMGSYLVSYTRAKGESQGIKDSDGGMMQRPERIVYLGCGAIFSPMLGLILRRWFADPMDYLFIAMLCFVAIMTLHTTCGRLLFYMNAMDRHDNPEALRRRLRLIRRVNGE